MMDNEAIAKQKITMLNMVEETDIEQNKIHYVSFEMTASMLEADRVILSGLKKDRLIFYVICAFIYPYGLFTLFRLVSS